MPNYALCKIYKIVSDHCELPYIGATCNPRLSTRLAGHRADAKIGRGCTSIEILKYNDAQIILIEEYPCKTKDELTKRERYWIEKLDCVNKNIPGRTHKEYYEQNKIKILEKQKKKIYCVYCDEKCAKGNFADHVRSKKHIRNFNISTDIINNLI